MLKPLALLLLLSACCLDPSDSSCTPAEKAALEADRAPQLIATQDGVRLYRVGGRYSTDVYFTTPCGDTSWDERVGKVTHHHHVTGIGCR